MKYSSFSTYPHTANLHVGDLCRANHAMNCLSGISLVDVPKGAYCIYVGSEVRVDKRTMFARNVSKFIVRGLVVEIHRRNVTLVLSVNNHAG
jgi:hypothetical protein